MHLALGVDHRIFRFEVAIDDTVRVQVVEGNKETGDIVFDHIEGLSLDPRMTSNISLRLMYYMTS